MVKRVFIILFATSLFFFSCGSKDDESHENQDDKESPELFENGENDEDEYFDNEGPDEVGDDDDDLQFLQTGGIAIFSHNKEGDKETLFSHKTILGQGGFFGFSIFDFSGEYWAVGALHESIPPYDFEKATGRVYFFRKGKLPENIEDAEFTLTHPELGLNVGFGFNLAKPCDINNDGFGDIVVSSHLANHGDDYAAGEFVVFYGSETGWSVENSSISRISDGLIKRADSMSQSLVCGDIDGDGFADVLAGGQNAGPELSGGGRQGMVAIFKGGEEGLEKHESQTLLPEVEQSKQYFGSSMIFEDIDGDGIKDLIVSGWGLKENDEANHTGGVYVYYGGNNWQDGPDKKYFGQKDSQFGSVIRIVEINGEKVIGVIAPQDGMQGKIHFLESEIEPGFVPQGMMNATESDSFSDFTVLNGVNEGGALLVAGGKRFFDGTGGLLCADIEGKTVSEWGKCPWQPQDVSGGFGYSVFSANGIDEENLTLIVGMPEYIHEF
ncbi:MAG: VCBS repeat-containing protein [bacterium]